MPRIEFFPYMGPNRRSDKTTVEITLHFTPEDQHGFPQRTSEIREALINGGVLTEEEAFPDEALPQERLAWYSSLLALTALLFQRKTGHRVSFYSVTPFPDQNRCIALVEHEHCDVGMTAVKLASEVLSGKRRFLDEPFRMFSRFARERVLPAETEAIIKAAQRRDIPCIQLERHPFKRQDFDHLTGGRCFSRNGLLMLGHGKHQRVLDGTYCLDRRVDFKDLLNNQDQRRAMLKHTDPDIPIIDSTAEILLDWLFPDATPVRMPIIAVTGTNGKTTTTRMISHIVSVSGLKPGMVCTDGIYLDGQLIEKEDQSTRTGHLKVLTRRAVDMAVLETHHSGILCRGFAFHWCDIAVCLNVTEDHLGKPNLETIEQMAAIKRALPERARHAVVLNADNQYCMAMLDSVSAEKTCLVSMKSARDTLIAETGGRCTSCCVLEIINGKEWIVFYDQGQRMALMATNDIPASFDGNARFNISNAMHAIAAAFLAGIDMNAIRSAMQDFRAGYDSTPGRMNVFDGLPFRVLMDYAHNADGFRNVTEFVDSQSVEGRKILMVGFSGDRLDANVRTAVTQLAGHFDHFVCRNFRIPRNDRQAHEIPALLKSGLISAGVAESAISIVPDADKAVRHSLAMGAPGDLVVLLVGAVEFQSVWDLLNESATGG